jgi:hypothetical protein
MAISGRIRQWGVAVALAFGLIAAPALAAEPVIVVSLKSFNELTSDAQYLGKVADQPQLGEMLPGLFAQIGGGQIPKGFDSTRPIVGYVTLSPTGQPDGGALCLPVTSGKDFAAALSAIFPDATSAGDITTYQIPGVPFPVVGKAGPKYYFLSIIPDALQELPDPEKLTTVKADIAVELALARIPEELKEMFLAQVEAGALQQNDPDASEEERQGREMGYKITLEGMRRLVLDGDRLSVGLNIDSMARNLSLNIGITSKSGTALASACTSLSKTESPFGGLISPQSIASLVLSAPMNDQSRSAFQLLIAAFEKGALQAIQRNDKLSDAERATGQTFFKRLSETMKSTAALDRVDQALVVSPAGANKIQLVTIAKVAKGKELATILEDILKSDAAKPGSDLKLGVATVAGSRVHSVKMPEDQKSPFADRLAHFAVTPELAVVVLGGDSLAALRKVLETKPAKTAAPIALRVKLANLLPVLPPESALPAEVTQGALAGGRDEVSLELTGQANGSKLRLEIQEGVLKLIALAAALQQQ